MTLEQKAWELFRQQINEYYITGNGDQYVLAIKCFELARDFEHVAGNYQASISHDEYLRKKAIEDAANSLVEKMGKYDFPVEAK
jgi:hypothetical protein